MKVMKEKKKPTEKYERPEASREKSPPLQGRSWISKRTLVKNWQIKKILRLV